MKYMDVIQLSDDCCIVITARFFLGGGEGGGFKKKRKLRLLELQITISYHMNQPIASYQMMILL